MPIEFPQPPYAGDAWMYRTFAGAVPDDWQVVCETHGGTFAKQQMAVAPVWPMRPAWAYSAKLIDGQVVKEVTLRWM